MAGITYTAKGVKKEILFDFDKDTATSTLRIMSPGDVILKITLEVTEVFAATKVITIGTPADNTKYVKTTNTDLTTIGVYEISQYYKVLAGETLAFYASGASATGAGNIFVELLQNN